MTRSILIAGAIGLGVITWIASGQFGADGRGRIAASASILPPSPQAEPILVRARTITAQPHIREIVLPGRSAAARWVDIKAETDGRVAEILAVKGGTVMAGEVIARLAIEARAARQAETEALLRQRKVEHEAATVLAAKGFRATTRVAESQAVLDAARAAVKTMEMEIARTVIRAPFAGVIESRMVEIGAYLRAGDTITRLVARDPMLIIAQVSERDIAALSLDQAGKATLVTGETVAGRIRFIASMADPATRTFTVELEVPNPDGRLKDGITADLRLEAGSQPAHLVTPAILTLDDTGAIGLRVIEGEARVAFKPVQILGDGPQGIWLRGLPDRVTVITVGQDFVRAGDRVRVALEDGSSP